MHYPHRAGKPYRPSNGTEGMIFEEQFCNNCKHCDTCVVILESMVHEIDDSYYPKQMIFDADGRPTCTAFERLGM